MKSMIGRFLVLQIALIFWCMSVCAAENTGLIEEPDNLYAQAAVLLDADSGRILFGKNSEEALPMASTTKIMTCILALENGNMDEVVTASAAAASQPKVRLGVSEGTQFLLRDLLYSLMLESHNDSAVMIAEHVGGSVEGFADMMNAKAAEIGCTDTYFITPNGLDAEDEYGIHHTTAQDLARIMKYCIKNSPASGVFIAITQTKEYQFTDCTGSVGYSCINHNSFLTMMEGALSGKTGYTNEAGYCYVGALEQDGKTLIVALLACGWPDHKGYKWADTKKLMTYGLENFDYENVWQETALPAILVKEGVPTDGTINGTACVETEIVAKSRELNILLRHDQEVTVKVEVPEILNAPVNSGEVIGKVQYFLNGEIIKEYALQTVCSVQKRSFLWSLNQVRELSVLGD